MKKRLKGNGLASTFLAFIQDEPGQKHAASFPHVINVYTLSLCLTFNIAMLYWGCAFYDLHL